MILHPLLVMNGHICFLKGKFCAVISAISKLILQLNIHVRRLYYWLVLWELLLLNWAGFKALWHFWCGGWLPRARNTNLRIFTTNNIPCRRYSCSITVLQNVIHYIISILDAPICQYAWGEYELFKPLMLYKII